MKTEKTVLVDIVCRELFVIRLCKDVNFGGYLYDFLIDLLEATGKEVTENDFADVTLFTQRESGQEKRQFRVSVKIGKVIQKYCFTNLRTAISDYAKIQKEIGKNILISLNNGDLTLKDFEQSGNL